MPRPKKAPVLNFLKCSKCRYDRQKCVPTERIWPDRCDRCKKFNYACSENLSKKAEEKKYLQDNDNPSPIERLEHKTIEKQNDKNLNPIECLKHKTIEKQNDDSLSPIECLKDKTIEKNLEDLGYLSRLSRRYQDLAENKERNCVEYYWRIPDDFAKNVHLALDIAIESGRVQLELLKTAKKHQTALLLHQRLSNVQKPFSFLDDNSISDCYTLAQLSENVGDYAAAEEYQECMILHDGLSWYNHPEPAEAEKTLLRLFEISDRKLLTVAARWKIDPSLALLVTLSPFRLFQSNKTILFSDQIMKIAQGSCRDILNRSLINIAARYGCVHVLRLLLSFPSGVNNVTSNELDVLINSADRNGHTLIVDEILANKMYNRGGNQFNLGTALIQAAIDGNVKATKLQLKKGANMEAEDEGGRTALQIAAYRGHEGVVKLLVEYGANIEVVDSIRWTPLHWAVTKRHEALIKLLLRRGANIEAADADGWRALHKAAQNGHEAVVELLLVKGAEIEAVDGIGWRALHKAAAQGHEAVVKLLVEYGANIEAEDRRGWRALDRAAYRGHEAVVKLLLEKGAKIKDVDATGSTMLYSVGYHRLGLEATAKRLLEKFAIARAKRIREKALRRPSLIQAGSRGQAVAREGG
ncbi:MAG: hypothetical protein M1824_003750 [Vezdaea acicularis]|nr:MAG: hypothetical protein M1824_003750 [Vezdaea acicularis]